VLVAGRDDEFHRWLGEGAAEPQPTACIEADGAVVGWVDADPTCSWLAAGEANVGYHVFAPARGRGYGTRAVQLLLQQLDVERAVLLIDAGNERSLALAARAGFARDGEVDGQQRWVRPTAFEPNRPQ
jgi:RimJ/RimL family protein N-acetyltransferase